MKMLALNKNVGALLKCLNIIKMLVLYWNVGTLLKCWHPMKRLVFYGNVGTLYNATCKNLQQLYKLTVSLLFGLARLHTALLCSGWWLSSSPEGIIHSMYQLPHAGQLIWVHCPHTGPPGLYRPKVGVLFKCWHSTQLKITEIGQYISLQPGITSKNGKSK